MLLENADYFVRLVPFPNGSADGAVMPNDDGTYSVYLDANADEAHRREALDHELRHIEGNHFGSEAPIEALEAEASGRGVMAAPAETVPSETGAPDTAQEASQAPAPAKPATVPKGVWRPEDPMPLPPSPWLINWQETMDRMWKLMERDLERREEQKRRDEAKRRGATKW